MLRGVQGLKSDERYLHSEQCAKDVEHVVCDKNPRRKSSGNEQEEHKNRDYVDDEGVATPGGDHKEEPRILSNGLR